MRLLNFKFIQFPEQQIIEIEHLNNVYDLHNASEFLRFEYIIQSSILKLFWNYYLFDKDVVPFEIVFNQVDFFEIKSTDVGVPKSEDDCLEEIMYDDKIKFIFMGGMQITVKADTVEFNLLSIE